MAQVTVDTLLHLQDFGLERLDEDRAIVGFAQKAEARLLRWLDFAKGALLFLMVPGTTNPEPSTSTTATGRLLSALAPDRAALRRLSRRGVRLSDESL